MGLDDALGGNYLVVLAVLVPVVLGAVLLGRHAASSLGSARGLATVVVMLAVGGGAVLLFRSFFSGGDW